MKVPEYPIKEIRKPTPKKVEQAPNVPIINIIRHGETDYKQRGPYYKKEPLNTNHPDFRLNSEHLDLTQEGILNIQKTAEQLVSLIDKETEVILIVSSPSWRAHSSALVAEEVFRKNGINLLNSAGQFEFFPAVDEMVGQHLRVNKIKEPIPVGAYDNTPEMQLVEAKNFQRFLRHMNNIYQWLSPETLKKLEGKRLRIVTFAHDENTQGFIAEAIPHALKQSRGQILEIIPQAQLLAGKKIATEVRLYPNPERQEEKSAHVVRSFKPKK